jgi:hypothetical protein
LSIEVFSRKRDPCHGYLPYSPDFAPADFWLFPELSRVLKGNCFLDIEWCVKNVSVFPIQDLETFEQ